MTAVAESPWFDLVADDAADALLVAIPYAGGAGRAFRPLRRHLPDGCGLALVDLPGHGRRLAEPCLRDAEAAVDGLREAVDHLPTSRTILLGYSLGGWLAFDLATRLADEGRPPLGVVICGSRAPQTGLGHRPIAHLPPGEPFLRAAVGLGLAAPEMLEQPSLAEVFGTALQADLTITASHRYRRREPLDVPGAVIGFAGDVLVTEPTLRAWDELFVLPPRHLRLDGGHLAVHEDEDAFGTVVRTAVEHVSGAGAGRA